VPAAEKWRALVVEDDPDFNEVLAGGLQAEGFEVWRAYDGQEAWEQAMRRRPAVLVIDRRLPDTDGVRLLGQMRARGLQTPAVIITAHPSLDSAIEALGWEAADYLAKPVNARHVAARARGLVELPTTIGCQYLWEALRTKHGFEHAFSANPQVQRCYAAAARVAFSKAPVLIEGETGVGKEYLARAIHFMSPRASGPFVAVNCAAVPETLLESELFGHEKGAFTSANARKKGLAEEADGGTLFLDEIGEMSPAMQAKLLRFLDDGCFRRLGGTEPIHVDVRIVSATNKDLEAEVREGRFRADLYYRLAVIPLYLPPLRKRPEDIAVFAHHFATCYAGREVEIAEAALEKLRSHSWPGNLRELRNVMQRALLLGRGNTVGPDDICFWGVGRGG
jgi:DNA-binding NtrC family response regulator